MKSIEQALAVNGDTFGAMVREGKATRKQIESLLMAHLVMLDACMKQKDGLTVTEVELIADEVLRKYPSLTFADIVVISREAKCGKFGELYNKLTSANVMKWFDDYFNRRCDTAYMINLNVDRWKYGSTCGKDSVEVLKDLGFGVRDGKVVGIDAAKVRSNNEKVEAKRKAEEAKRKGEAEYIKWRDEQKKKWAAEAKGSC